MATLNITNIPAPRVPFIDERTGLMAREWYRFFLNLFILTGSGNNPITLEELQIGPPNQPDLAELLIQINQNIAPQYEDQSGDFLATLDTAQLMSMMSRFENAEAAIQGAYLQPVVQTGTIANYNLDGSPTAGGVAYGTGPALAVSAAGSSGQVLTSAGAGTPIWTTNASGDVSGPASSTDNAIARFDGITGKLIQNSLVIVDDTGSVTGVNSLTAKSLTVNDNATLGFSNTDTLDVRARIISDLEPNTNNAKDIGTNGRNWRDGFFGRNLDTVNLSVTGTTSFDGAQGTAGQVLTSSGTGATPTWTTPTTGTVTSVAQSFTGGLISVAGSPITTSGTLALTVAGTSGGIPYFSSASTWASSAALAAGSLVLGGGAGATPATTATGTGVVTALGVNTGTAGAFVVNGGALGTPSSGTVTNLTGTASININGTVGATTATTGAFTTMQASTGAAVGGATPGAGGIAFPATAVAVADPNTLDDYEEGSWTPSDGSGAALSFTSVTGTYTKIGRQVTAVFGLTYPVTVSAAGATIASLPFTSISSGVPNPIGGFLIYSDYITAPIQIAGGQSATAFSLYISGSTALTNANLSGKLIRMMVIYNT